MALKDHLEAVAARQSDPSLFTDGQQRQNAITSNLGKSDANAIGLMIQESLPRALKVIMLKKLTDELAKATKGIVPCKSGCSHCCHMATNITIEEAEALSKASCKPLTIPGTWDDKDIVQRFEGIPCPFLVDSKCSVYDARPFPCRTHYSVDRDNLLCKIIPGHKIRTPNFNNEKFNLIAMLSYEDPQEVKFADIREFFPKA